MISPLRNLALAAATLVTGSIAATADAGHAPATLPPATPYTSASHGHAGPVYGGPAIGGGPACPPAPTTGTAVEMYTAPAPAVSTGRIVTGTSGSAYNGGRVANAQMSLFNGGYFFLGQNVGDGIGYNNGYTLFGGYVPLMDTAKGDGLWAAQGQYMILQDDGFEGDSAFSIGLVRRQVVGAGVLSAGAFYDYDQRFGGFDRVGFNLGYQGCRFGVWGNYYNTLDAGRQLSQHTSHPLFVANDGTGNGSFNQDPSNHFSTAAGNVSRNGHNPYAGHAAYGHPGGRGGFDNIAQDIVTQGVTGLDGFDVNFSYLMLPSRCDCCRGLRGTAGFYGYNGAGLDSFYGYRLGLIYDANPNFLVQGQLNDDDQFGTTVNATAIWTPCRKTPSRLAKVCCGTDSCGRPRYSTRCVSRSPFLYDLVQRQNRIGVARTQNVERVFLTDPKTGERYRVVHATTTNSDNYDGDAAVGTSLNPHRTLADASAFSGEDDILYLHGGSDFDENLTLQTGQDVVGEGTTKLYHSVEHGDFSLGLVTGDTSRATIGSAANIGVGGDAINVGNGDVMIDHLITRGDIDANNVAGRLAISDTIVDCGQIRIVNYGAIDECLDGSVTLTGVRVFTEAGSNALALEVDNIAGDFQTFQYAADGLAGFNDAWYTLNLAAPNDNWDGRNGFFSQDAAAASVTNVGGNIVVSRSVFFSAGIDAGTHPANTRNVTLSGAGDTGIHIANSDFSNQILSLTGSAQTFLENAEFGGVDFPLNTLPAVADATIIDALFSMGNEDVNAGSVEVLANPIRSVFLPTALESVNPEFFGDDEKK